MIGAEILALVAMILGAGLGWRTLAARGVARREKRKEDAVEEADKHKEMREALAKPGAEPIDVFLALWEHKLTKEEKKHLEAIRDDRVIARD